MRDGLVTLAEVRAAAEAIAAQVVRTPTVVSPGLQAALGVPVWCKLESLQLAGSFKPRGITNKFLSLSAEERARGLITVSGGNHGLAMARIGRQMGVPVTVAMPKTAPQRSIDSILADGARLELRDDVAGAFAWAEAQAREHALTYVHPFDDPALITGHGTLGLEFIEDAPALTDVLVSIGGGGMIAGVAVALKALKPGIRIWGVETSGADAMARALAAGAPVPITVTSIATTLGAPRVSELTLVHVRALVEDVLLVSDAEAVAGCVTLAHEAKLLTEPATGCLIPAAREVLTRLSGDVRLGLVICGGNVTLDALQAWREHSS